MNGTAPIEEVEVGCLPLSLRSTFRTHWKTLRSHSTLHVRVRSGDLWGEGEAYALDVEAGLAVLRGLSLQGLDPWDLDSILSSVPDNAARSAVDLALHDLLGKRTGLPVRRLLGLSFGRRTTCVSVGIDEPEAMIAAARRWISEGYPILKVKITTTTDLSVLEKIRAIGGPHLRIWVDANQAFEPEQAAEAARCLERIGAEIFEQPLPVGRISEYAALSARVPIPIYLDEDLRCAVDVARAAAAGGIDGVNVKLAKMGGLRECLRAIQVTRAHGLHVLLGCFFESSLGIAGCAQLLPLADHVDLDAPLFVQDDPYRGLVYSGASIAPPPGAGLGVCRR